MYPGRYHADNGCRTCDDVKECIDSIKVGQSCHEGSYTAQPYDKWDGNSTDIPVVRDWNASNATTPFNMIFAYI